VLDGWTSIHWLWRLRQPTLILYGRDDPIVPWINGWIMAQLIRDYRLHIFNDGQLGLMTSARELASSVCSFLVDWAYYDSIAHDELDLGLEHADVVQWVAVYHDEVRPLADLDGADLLVQAQQTRGVDRA
jgi:alpha/beta hydrolase family protein